MFVTVLVTVRVGVEVPVGLLVEDGVTTVRVTVVVFVLALVAEGFLGVTGVVVVPVEGVVVGCELPGVRLVGFTFWLMRASEVFVGVAVVEAEVVVLPVMEPPPLPALPTPVVPAS